MHPLTTHAVRVLATHHGIDAGYLHRPKHVTPGEPLEIEGALLKWYAVHVEDMPVPAPISGLARMRLTTTALEARGFGAVILHRCGADFYFLILCTWRHSNELWETVFYKDATMSAFAPFPRDGEHKPAFCVWELVPVWHEQKAWVRFLESARDEAALQTWLADSYLGPA